MQLSRWSPSPYAAILVLNTILSLREERDEINQRRGRGGAPASHGVQRDRRPRGHQGRTAPETQARGGRYFKYRPPLGRCEPSDGELAVQIAVNGLQSQWLTGSFSVLVSSTSGSRWSFAGRTLGARLWCSGSAVSVRRLTTQETAPPLLAGEARPIWSGRGVREPSRRGKPMPAGRQTCAASGSHHVPAFTGTRLPPRRVASSGRWIKG